IAPCSFQSKSDVVFLPKLILEEIGLVVEIVGHDVESASASEVSDCGATRAARGPLTGDSFLQVLASRRWLNALAAGSIGEGPIAVVHHEGVRPVGERKAHAGRKKHVLVTVIVEVAGHDAPRPERLDARLVGYLLEFSPSKVSKERVSEDN